MSWNEVFSNGIELWISQYCSKEKYYKYEGNLCKSLLESFQKVAKEKGLALEEIQQEKGIIGRTRVDFLLGNEVSVEVKFEPDYPNMPITRKPVTNVVLKAPDIDVAKYAGLKSAEARMRLYEIELDFLKLIAHKKLGIMHNYLLCVDEDGKLYRTLSNSFKTHQIRRIAIPWQSMRRGIDGRKVYYFLWHA